MFDIYFNIHRLSKVWGQQVKKLLLFFLKDHVALKDWSNVALPSQE